VKVPENRRDNRSMGDSLRNPRKRIQRGYGKEGEKYLLASLPLLEHNHAQKCQQGIGEDQSYIRTRCGEGRRSSPPEQTVNAGAKAPCEKPGWERDPPVGPEGSKGKDSRDRKECR
jgi:hypothetical protein